MNRVVLSFAVVGLLVLGMSCSSAPSKPVLVDIAWSLTCTGTPPVNCNPLNVAGKSWDYVAASGTEATDTRNGMSIGQIDARCKATDIGNGNVRVAMRAIANGAYLAVDNFDINRTTGALIGSSCRTTAYDGINTFGGTLLGACSTAAPTTNVPCQVSNVVVNPNDIDGPSIQLRLFCNGVASGTQPSSKVSVRDSSDVFQPALIRFASCTGL